jgi:DNA topoisomerase-1
MAVVVVESPAKAKTINKYLGDGFTVLASYGHVRDLPPKDGSVDPENGFEMLWEIGADSRKHVKAIADALANDNELILATDPDREGEAISWHLEEALRKRKAIKKSTSRWWTPIWPAARWITSWASTCRPCCGANCPARNRPVGCNPSACA